MRAAVILGQEGYIDLLTRALRGPGAYYATGVLLAHLRDEGYGRDAEIDYISDELRYEGWRSAGTVLAHVGEPAVVYVAEKLSHSRETEHRRRAAWTLRNMAPRVPEALAELKKYENDEDEEVARFVREGILSTRDWMKNS